MSQAAVINVQPKANIITGAVSSVRKSSLGWRLFYAIWIIGALDISGDYPNLWRADFWASVPGVRYAQLVSTGLLAILALVGVLLLFQRPYRASRRIISFLKLFTGAYLFGICVAIVMGVRLDFIFGDSRNLLIYLAVFAIPDIRGQDGLRKIYMLLATISAILLIKLGISIAYDIIFGGGINLRYLFKFSPILLAILVLTLSFYLHSTRRKDKRRVGLAFGLLGVALFFAQTRGIFLGELFGFAFLLATNLTRTNLRRFLVAFVALLGAGVVVAVILFNNGTQIFGDWSSENDFQSGINIRRVQAKNLLNNFMEHPITGIGLGGYDKTYERYSEGSSRPYLVELEYVNLLAKLGIVGTTLLISAFACLILEGLRLARRAKNQEQKALSLGLTGGLVAMMVSSATNPLYSSIYFHLYVVLVILAFSALHRIQMEALQMRIQKGV